MSELYDTIVVGGGPAGLSAALHLAWHNRRVLVIDRKTGPLLFTLEKLYNVPGFPEMSGVQIVRALTKQAKERGAEVVVGNVVRAAGQIGDFQLEGAKGEEWRAKTVLLATGVARFHPLVDGDHTPCFKYAGKGNMFYCPDCEAPEIEGKDTIVIAAASARGGAGMSLGLSRYTDRLRVLLTADAELPDEMTHRLAEKGIGVVEGKIKNLQGEGRELRGLELESGEVLEAEAFFVSSSVTGRTDLAKELGVEIAATGVHAQPKSQRGDTNVPGVWIAGDLRPMTQQVSVALGTGNLAAIMIDQHLRKGDIA
ncbi:MAG: NAD(P)/FAD-dependent oxidoreductase [Planctomycetota bacterium]